MRIQWKFAKKSKAITSEIEFTFKFNNFSISFIENKPIFSSKIFKTIHFYT